MSASNRKTVFVMLSGGVDSSVAAYLLKRQGYKVIGVFMRNWSERVLRSLSSRGYSSVHSCPWRQDQAAARQVAEVLQIPFYTFNFEQEYKSKVVEYLKNEYASGRTPNPDVLCNSLIKFGLFFDKARQLGADYIATGHYVRVRRTSSGQVKLLRARDEHKDQSYFLWQLTQHQLQAALFPIGEFASKQMVREVARQAGLPTYNRPDSQGICFIGELPVRQFLLDTLGEHPGQIVRLEDGEVLGTHSGAYLYTRGQRRGLGIGGGVPYYVAQTDVRANRVYVVPKQQEKILYDTQLIATQINWLRGEAPPLPLAVKARIRHGQPLQSAWLDFDNSQDRLRPARSFWQGNDVSLVVKFDQPQRAITPGQSVVFYRQDEVLGGGVIS